MYVVVRVELLLEAWTTKIKHTNCHVYSISRRVHIDCLDEILLLWIYCSWLFPTINFTQTKLYTHACHGKPLVHRNFVKKYCWNIATSRQYQTWYVAFLSHHLKWLSYTAIGASAKGPKPAVSVYCCLSSNIVWICWHGCKQLQQFITANYYNNIHCEKPFT